MLGCNRRYLEYLSSLDDFVAGIRTLDRLTQPRPVKGHTVRGLNFFSRAEQTLLAAIQPPAFNIAGLLPLLVRCSPPPSPDTSRAYANSASSNASPAPIAIVLPVLAAPPLRLVAASLNTPSFRLLPDKSAHKFQRLSS